MLRRSWIWIVPSVVAVLMLGVVTARADVRPKGHEEHFAPEKKEEDKRPVFRMGDIEVEVEVNGKKVKGIGGVELVVRAANKDKKGKKAGGEPRMLPLRVQFHFINANKPAKAIVMTNGKQWEVTEKEISKLPARIRPYVARMFGGVPGPGIKPVTMKVLVVKAGDRPAEAIIEMDGKKLSITKKVLDILPEKSMLPEKVRPYIVHVLSGVPNLSVGLPPAGMKVAVVKRGDHPTKVIVELNGKRWEVTKENLGKLPENIRPHVAKILSGEMQFKKIEARVKMSEK